MIQRLIAVVVGLALVAVVVAAGVAAVAANEHWLLIILFGVLAALLTPLGLSVLIAGLMPPQLVKPKLADADLQLLIEQARSEAERLHLLEERRRTLAEAVRLETRRQVLKERVNRLEEDASRVLQDLHNADAEIGILDASVRSSQSIDEVRELRDRLDAKGKGDIIFQFHEKQYRLSPDLLDIPFVSAPLVEIARAVAYLLNRLQKPRPKTGP